MTDLIMKKEFSLLYLPCFAERNIDDKDTQTKHEIKSHSHLNSSLTFFAIKYGIKILLVRFFMHCNILDPYISSQD